MKKLISFWTLLCLFIPYCSIAQTQLTNLPTIWVTTNDGSAITDKEIYNPATVTIRSSVASQDITNVSCGIRGRGNSTWGMPKKPYRIKLDKKAHFCGLPANEKSWVLLANYADKTLMRDAVADKISELVGMPFTPAVQFVDVYVNNEYQGNYMLTDQVQDGSDRVPVETLTAANTTEPTITGGYLLELDGFADAEPLWFTTSHALKITIHYPDDTDTNDEQKNYIINYINDFESHLFSTDFKDPDKGYRAMVDTTSLINWYIACELTGNSDSFWSTYIYKLRNNNKLYFGPLWDYDIAFNNDNRLGDATNKLMREYAHNPRTWIEQLAQDEWFIEAVERRWIELVNSGIQDVLINYIDDTATLIDASQKLNYQKWNTLNTRVYLEEFLFDTYAGGVDYLKKYIKDRIAFLNTSLVGYTPPQPTQPFVAENYYYSFWNKHTNNAIDVTDGSTAPNALLMLWGPSETNDSQLWKIEAIDNTYFRITNKKSGLVMTANGWVNNLVQKEWNAADNAQKWKIIPVLTGGLYGIVSDVAPDYYVVDNNGGFFDNGNKVIVYDNQITTNENQQWYIQKIKLIDDNSTGIIQPEKLPFEYYVSGNDLVVNNLSGNTLLRVFDLQGVRIQEISVNGEQANIILPQKGIYILNIITESETYSVKVVM